MAAKWAQPLVGAPHAKRRYTTKEHWTNERKAIILRLRNEGKSTNQIREIMFKEYRFDASISMYKNQFKLWKTRLHLNEKQRRYIIQQRTRLGRMPTFKYVDSREKVDSDKLQRLWENRSRYGNIPEDESLSPGGLYISTPSSPAEDCTLMDTTVENSCIIPQTRPEVSSQIGNHKSVIASKNLPLNDSSDPMIIDEYNPEIELFRTMDPNQLPGPNQICGTSLTVFYPIDIVIENIGKYFHHPAQREASVQITSLTDDEINHFLLRILKTLNIPVDYHIQNSKRELLHPVQSFAAWEQATYQENAAVRARPNSAWERSPPLPLKVLATATEAEDFRPISYTLQPYDLTVPSYDTLLDSSMLLLDTEYLRARVGFSTEAPGSPSLLADLKIQSASLLQRLLDRPDKITKIEAAMNLTRSWDELNEEEQDELMKSQRELGVFEEALRQSISWTFRRSRPDQITAQKVEKRLRTYRRLFGSAADETLDIELHMYHKLLDMDGVNNQWLHSRLERTFRLHWKVFGADSPRTRTCLNLLGRAAADRDEAVLYFHLAMNGQVYPNEQGNRKAFDVLAMETMLSLIRMGYDQTLDYYGFYEYAREMDEEFDELEARGAATRENAFDQAVNIEELGWYELHRFVEVFLKGEGPKFYEFGLAMRILRYFLRASNKFDLADFSRSRQYWNTVDSVADQVWYGSDKTLREAPKVLTLLTQLYALYTRGCPPDLDEWVVTRIFGYSRNLFRIARTLKTLHAYSNSLRVLEQLLDYGVRLGVWRWRGKVVEEIVNVLTLRGPTLYLQPLLFYAIEKKERRHEDAMDLVLLFGKVTLQSSGLMDIDTFSS